MKINQYETIVFDCDGVILDSNKVKTHAFYLAALPYGERAAQALVDYHCRHGGISRYKKFSWFLEQQPAVLPDHTLEVLLEKYASYVWDGLLKCNITESLKEVRENNKQQRWLIVSGGDQAELREVFSIRSIDSLFNGGIFGSPDSKDIILARELQSCNISGKALFIGDSRYDYEVAHDAGLDFIFVSNWSEFSSYKDYFKSKDVFIAGKVADLV